MNFCKLLLSAAFAVVTIAFCTVIVRAQRPTISYQGLLENNGVPDNGSENIHFSIYTIDSGGTAIYTEEQTVSVASGIFNMAIGSVTPLTPTLDFKKQYWLGISVGNGPELSPRSLVSFAPYAFHALNADTALYVATAGRANVANSLSGGAVTSLNGTYGAMTLSGTNGITVTTTPGTVTIGNSGVQTINTTGGKLTLVGTGGTTIADTGTTITIHSQTFTGGTGIQAIQNSDSSITVVNGSGPIATISLGKQGALNGQVLSWNNQASAWRPATTVTGIQNTDTTLTITNPNGPTTTINLSSQNATSGQVLLYNGKSWRPATVSGVGPDSIKNLGDARVNIPKFNLYLGAGSGTRDNGTTGFNTAVGIQALDSNNIGGNNVAIGPQSLFYNTTGNYNIGVGEQALESNTTGSGNIAVGFGVMESSPFETNSGSKNCAIGTSAMGGQGTDSLNVAIGAYASFDRDGSYNTAIGFYAMANGSNNLGVSHLLGIGDSALCEDAQAYEGSSPDSAVQNTALGSGSMRWTETGSQNTATGYQTLHQNLRGFSNTADGASALWNTTGNYNTGVGSQALIANTAGNNNTAVGYLALNQNTGGTNNAAFGDNSGPNSGNLSYTTCVGSGAQATSNGQVVLGGSNTTSLYCIGAYTATTANSANLYVASNGQIMRSTSSARYKTNIRDLDFDADKLYDLRPVSYTSKIDGKEYFGLVAEDVAKVLPELADYARARDVIPGSTSDKLIPDAVKYPMLSVILLQELKKEHLKVYDEQKTIESQQKAIDDLAKRVEALEAAGKSNR